MTKWLAVLAIVLGGCDLYFGGGDDDPCNGGGARPYGDDGIAYELRNPDTGQCEYGGGGGYPCDDACGPCPLSEGAATPTSPLNWGACYGKCSGLDEQSCFAASGCYAAYLDDGLNGLGNDFWGCWDTAPSGPTPGSCHGLGAQQCSEHDNCIAVYSGYPNIDTAGGDTKFDYCAPESGATSCANVNCGSGWHCEEQCYAEDEPNSGMTSTCAPVCVQDLTCASVDCAPGYTCAQVCEADGNGQLKCHPSCVPDNNDPGACTGTVLCDALPPACPQGTTAGIRNGCYTGYCIPNAACGPNDPGECYGAVNCFANPPQCPSGTVAGVTNGCWSGYCIPQSQCPAPACETLSSEQACTMRGDCTPVYDGTDCTCYPNYCECQVLTYDRCESALMPL